MSIRKRVAPLPLALLLALAALPATAKLNLEGPAPLQWQAVHGKTATELVARLESQHYRKQPFDDSMSAQLLDSYLKSLDPARLFLLQSDISSFERYRLTLDDSVHAGDLEPSFVMFRRYQERVINRLRKVLSNLPATVAAMDFTADEYLEVDRSKSPWPKNETEADELWRLRLKNSVLSLRLAGKKEDEIVKLLERRHRNQLNRVMQYSGEDVFQIFLNALTGLYDPHTNYLSPRTSENFNINMSLKLEGIGAVLQAEDEYTKVARLVPAGPAAKQGELKTADRIVAVGEGVDGEMKDVVGWRLDDVVALIRGPKGSVVRLEVIPAGAKSEEERRTIAITRNEVKLEEQSAQKRIIEVDNGTRKARIGVIDLPAFYIDFEAARRGDPDFKSTTRDVQKLLTELMAEAVDGVVIDLRENGGGSLQEANALTGLFIDSGPIVQIRHSSLRSPVKEGKPRSTPFYDGPLAVLINRLSASASEIFAGAIQDYQRGIIIGDQSFGKGTVQSLTPLQYGELKLTESKFYRISGDSTQHRGIVPDVVFPALYDPTEVGESALEKALPWDRIAPVRHQIYYDIPSVLPQLVDNHLRRVKKDPDFIYLQAQLALAEEQRKQRRISLNEEKRRQERALEKERALAIENARRKAKGLEPLKELADAPPSEDLADPLDKGLAGTGPEDGEQQPDPLLTEAAKVLVDALPVYRKPSYAYRNY